MYPRKGKVKFELTGNLPVVETLGRKNLAAETMGERMAKASRCKGVKGHLVIAQ